MRISDWSSDVCSSDLAVIPVAGTDQGKPMRSETIGMRKRPVAVVEEGPGVSADVKSRVAVAFIGRERRRLQIGNLLCKNPRVACGFPIMRNRSEEHTSELQSLMRISYAVFCLKQKKTN